MSNFSATVLGKKYWNDNGIMMYCINVSVIVQKPQNGGRQQAYLKYTDKMQEVL
jgi:hypothetical protein